MKLADKVAIVVGATSGIGEGIAKEFAAEGASVIVTGRRAANGQKIVNEIQENGGKAEFMQLDVVDTDACRKLIDVVVAKYGKLDILEYNAGVGHPFPIDTGSEELWDLTLNTNLRSAFFMSQHALSHLEKSKGNIVYTASMGGISPRSTVSSIAYGTSKAAILHMMKILALLVADRGIRVNAIGPGVTYTEMVAQAPKEVIDGLAKEIPLHYIGSTEDMAKAASYLASEEAKYITGHMLVLDGGLSIG